MSLPGRTKRFGGVYRIGGTTALRYPVLAPHRSTTSRRRIIFGRSFFAAVARQGALVMLRALRA